jgi:hypothetical protein
VSADIAEAAETASAASKGIAHNSPPVAVEYDSPLAATETAGAAVNNTTRKKTDRSGEAPKDHMKPEAPLTISQTPNNPDTELHSYHMHRQVLETQRKKTKQIPTEARFTKIRNYRKQRTQYSTASPLRLGGGSPCNKKRKKSDCLEPAFLHGTDPIRIPLLTDLLDTYTDEQYTATIRNLPDAW